MCVTCVKYTQLPIDSCWAFCLFFWIYPIITDLFIMWRGGDYPKMKTTKDIHATLMITLVHPERNDFNHVDELWHISIYPKRTPFLKCYKSILSNSVAPSNQCTFFETKLEKKDCSKSFTTTIVLWIIENLEHWRSRWTIAPFLSHRFHVWFHHPVFRRKPMRPKSSPHQFSFVFQLICLFLCIFPSSLGDQASECIGPSGAFSKKF